MRALKEKDAVNRLVKYKGRIYYIESIDYVSRLKAPVFIRRAWRTRKTLGVLALWVKWSEIEPHTTRSGRTHRR